MASPSISNLESNPARKRRKIGNITANYKIEKSNWRTETQQQIYSAKLIEALCQSHRDSSSPRPTAVRAAADRALAASAKGRTRWSRATLTSRLGQKLGRNEKHKKVKVTGNSRLKKPVVGSKLPIQKKVRALSRLVPGCRNVSFPNLLEETTDYIPALEMQVRAMSALAGLLTGGAGLSGSVDGLGHNVS